MNPRDIAGELKKKKKKKIDVLYCSNTKKTKHKTHFASMETSWHHPWSSACKSAQDPQLSPRVWGHPPSSSRAWRLAKGQRSSCLPEPGSSSQASVWSFAVCCISPSGFPFPGNNKMSVSRLFKLANYQDVHCSNIWSDNNVICISGAVKSDLSPNDSLCSVAMIGRTTVTLWKWGS